MDTKNRILEAALSLFAQKGYHAASMSDIAEKLGITKGALYRHYSGKRAILDSIVARMQQQDSQQAQSCSVPEETLQSDPAAYRETSMQEIRAFAMEQFRYWTQDIFASGFRRLLVLERFHDPEMMQLFQNYLCAGPLSYMEDLFREMAAKGSWSPDDAPAMALEFYGPMYLLMDAANSEENFVSAQKQLEVYIDRFIEEYTS